MTQECNIYINKYLWKLHLKISIIYANIYLLRNIYTDDVDVFMDGLDLGDSGNDIYLCSKKVHIKCRKQQDGPVEFVIFTTNMLDK